MPEVCNMRDLEGEKFVFGFNTGSFQNFLFKMTFSIQYIELGQSRQKQVLTYLKNYSFIFLGL